MTEGDPEELIACPFDPVHLLRRKRMPYHIIKCGKVGGWLSVRDADSALLLELQQERFQGVSIQLKTRGAQE